MALEIPLFPLNLVMFPGTELPLHIFEPRYRLMINECYERGTPFGIVLVRPESQPLHEEPYPVGTMAEIEALDRMADGRMNLIAHGLQRFRILSQHRDRPYLSGVVELYNDTAEAGSLLDRPVHQASTLFRTYWSRCWKWPGVESLSLPCPTMPKNSHILLLISSIFRTSRSSTCWK